jgi:hypothetical protein
MPLLARLPVSWQTRDMTNAVRRAEEKTCAGQGLVWKQDLVWNSLRLEMTHKQRIYQTTVQA